VLDATMIPHEVGLSFQSRTREPAIQRSTQRKNGGFSSSMSTAGEGMVGPRVGVAGVETLVQQTARAVLLVDVTILCRQERSEGGGSLSCYDLPQAHARQHRVLMLGGPTSLSDIWRSETKLS